MRSRSGPCPVSGVRDVRLQITARIPTLLCLSLLAVFFLAIPTGSQAAFKDLKLTDKVTGKDFVAGKIRHRNSNVTVVTYTPRGKKKPVTVMVYDTFRFGDHIADPVEKEVFRHFEFRNAAFFAIPEGAGVWTANAKDLPAPLVKALGGAKSGVFPLELRTGAYFVAKAQLTPGSIHETLFKSMGVKKTSHIIKGLLTDDFLDITDIILGRIKAFWKNLLAKIRIDFRLPDLKPDFYLPFKFANSSFDISREKDIVTGQSTGVIVASLQSDIQANLGNGLKQTYPAVRISGKLDTGISFRTYDLFDWPKLPNMPWVSIYDVRLNANVVRKVPLGDPTLVMKMTAKGRVNQRKDIPIEGTVEVQGKNISGPEWSFRPFAFDLGKIPGLKDIPGLKGVRLEDPIVSPTAIGGKLSVDKLNITRADVLFFQTDKPKGWNFATVRDNLSTASLIRELKGTVIEKVRFRKAALIVSKPGFSGKVSGLPKKVRTFLQGPLPQDDMDLPLASGINIAGVFYPRELGEVGKGLRKLGTPDEVVMLGGVVGVFDSKPRTVRLAGSMPKLTLPDIGIIDLPQPKNAPRLFIEYLNNRPALGVEVIETLSVRDGKRSVPFDSKLALTISPTGAASVSMSGKSTRDWANPYGIDGLILKTGTELAVAGGIVGPQVSFTGRTTIGSKNLTIGGTLAAAGAAFRGSIDSLGLADVAALAAQISKAGGKKLNTDGLPVAEFRNVDIAFASPGVSVPDLQIAGGGTRMKGDLHFLSPKKALVRADVNLDVTGMAIKTALADIPLGPLVLKNNRLDTAAKTSAPPHFAIQSETRFLGALTAVKLVARTDGVDIQSTQKFGTLFEYGFRAVGRGIDWGAPDFSKVDLWLDTSLKSDPAKWFRESAAPVVRKAFDSLKPGLNQAAKDLTKAQKEVDRLNGEIEKQRAIVSKEKEPGVNRLKAAEAEVTKLDRTIGGFNKDISRFNKRIKRCNQNSRPCVLRKPKTKCKKKEWGVCVSWKTSWPCAKRATVPNVKARAQCEFNNTKARAERVVAEGKKAAVVGARATAYETVKALRKGVEALPVDLDPRVAPLIAAREVAKGTLEAAKQTVKGIGNFTDFLSAGVAAVGKSNAFKLDNSRIQGSLSGGVKGDPVILDMAFNMSGKPFKGRLGFSLTDWKYNAKQFEVIALGAAVKAVIDKANKAKVTPHELLERINELFLARQAAADKEVEKAIAKNGEIDTEKGAAVASLTHSIDAENKKRRARHEAEQTAAIKLRDKLRGKVDDDKLKQLAALLDDARNWVKMTGKAVDIGAGANGAVYVVGTNGSPYAWTGKDWKKLPGGLVRLDAAPDGKIYGVSKDRKIWRWDGNKWHQLSGKARDIGVGANGKVWVIGNTKGKGGYEIFHLTASKWRKIKGTAVRIDVDPDGNPWVVNKHNNIWRYTLKTKKWDKMPGKAIDIAVSSNGAVMVIGKDRTPWVWTGRDWLKLPGGNLVNLTLDRDGMPWGTTQKNVIYAYGDAGQARAAKVENLSAKKLAAQTKAQQQALQKKMQKVIGKLRKGNLDAVKAK